MKVTPIATTAEAKTAPQADSRARAIEAFNKATQAQTQTTNTNQTQAQEHPVQNPSQVSPEEMTAVKAPTETAQTTENVNKTTISDEKVDTTPVTAQAKDPVLEKQFAELSRQERILRAKAQKQAQEIKTQQDALNAQKASLDEQSKKYEQGYVSKDRFKQDPLAALTEAGLSYDDLTQQLLNQQPKDPRVEATMNELRAEINKLNNRLEEGQKSQTERQQEEYKSALRQIKYDTVNLVKEDAEAYEAIAKTNSYDDVVELIERTYNEEKRIMSVQEAAQEVENYLVEEGFNTVSRIDKIKKRLQQTAASTAAPAKVEQAQAKQEQTQPAPMKTLTNAASSTRKLSARERALLAFKGELKS